MKHFKLRDLGQARSFLGIKIEKNVPKDGGLAYTLSMPGYIRKLLKDNQMHEANPVSRPASPNEKINDAGEECIGPSAARSCIGGLLWAAVTVRPDILSKKKCSVQAYALSHIDTGRWYEARVQVFSRYY
jgi:hypothetical protein